ncbi:MAG: YeeE/YedE family protein [Rhodocyclaceae bacterium]|jgi:hypothetical protein|nr:YeeE/YedE family protein [Rhodocyclaceae bacterium]
MIDHLFPNGIAHYLIGGACIGLATALLYLTTGRQGGVSTFFSSVWSYCLRTPFFQQESLRASRHWRLVFTLGLVLGGTIYAVLGLPLDPTAVPVWRLALGGVLVGYGARLGGGCTSGHGICGMASLSGGSLAMVVVFVSTAIVTASLLTFWGV